MNAEEFAQTIMPRIADFLNEAYTYSDAIFVVCGHRNEDDTMSYVMSTNDPSFKDIAEAICANMDLMQAINNILSDAITQAESDEKAVDKLICEVFNKDKNNEK